MEYIKHITVIVFTILLTGCPLDGDNGSRGPQGEQGQAGINCWDLNEDGVDDPNEDRNKDGIWNVLDCQSSNAGEQHPDAQYNFQSFCEAFANLGQYPQGCPSDSHVTPTGTLTAMIPSQFDGSYLTCSDLSITVENNVAFWTLDNGFVASSEVLSIADNDQCRSSCASDPNCVASEWHLRSGVGAGDCQLYYHSDSLSQPYKRQCGIDVPSANLSSADACFLALGSDTVWHAQCP